MLPLSNTDLRAEVAGIIAEVYRDEGDRVKAGDLIARLSDLDYRAELRKVEAETDEKRAKLRMLKAGPRREEIDRARTEVATATARLEHARKRYDEAVGMRAQRRAKAEATLEKAEERLKYAQYYLDLYKPLVERGLISLKDFPCSSSPR